MGTEKESSERSSVMRMAASPDKMEDIHQELMNNWHLERRRLQNTVGLKAVL